MEWVEEQKLISSSPVAQENFGERVAIEGDRVVISSPNHDSGRGRLHSFERVGSEWVLGSIVTAPEPQPLSFFGISIALDGDALAVGAFEHDGAIPNSGAAFVFRRIAGQWTPESQLDPSDPTPFSFFGETVAIDGDSILVGSPDALDEGADTGAVYRFVGSEGEWALAEKIVPGGSVAGDRVGEAVALTPELEFVSAPKPSGPPPAPGKVHILPRGICFLRGDCNSDGFLDIADGVFGLNYLFQSGPVPTCLDSCDTNDDGIQDLTDPLFVFAYALLAGPFPPAPFPVVGSDPTEDGLACSDLQP